MRIIKKCIISASSVIVALSIFFFFNTNYKSFVAFGSTRVKVNSCAVQSDTGNISDNANIKAAAAIVVDLDSGKTLYSKNTHQKLYPASITKLMTALLLTEKEKPADLLTYTAEAKTQPSNHLNFAQGSILTAENALHGMLIFSANDMATMVADNISGSTPAFAALMNKKAKTLGMNDTHFANANGLQNKNHYTTAYDISLLARTVYKNKRIMDCLETPSYVVETESGTGYTIHNTNETLDKDGCFAGKTGFTTPAKYCLAAFYRKDGKTVVGVVLKSPTDKSLYTDMNSIINRSLSTASQINIKARKKK